jgi:hypothetical protein
LNKQRLAMNISRSLIDEGWYIVRDSEAWRAMGPKYVGEIARPTGYGRSPQEAHHALAAKYRMRGMLFTLPPLDDFLVKL